MPPITPEQLAEASTRLDKLTQKLEKTILDDICRRIAKAGTITDTAEWQMMRLKEMGYANEVIEKAIADYTKMSEAEIRQLFFEAGQVSDDFYEEVYSKAGMPFVPLEENPYMQQFLSAGIEQTNNELVNFTRSMGFAVRQADGTLAFQGVAETYQSALDLAQMQVATGVFDYTTAIRNATKSLTDSGLQFVDYASGHRNKADVAARRAVLTGISQMTGKIAEHNMDELGTEYVEVTAHAGARPDHAVWQGKIYRWKRSKSLDNGGGSGILNINGGSINGYTFEAVDTKFVGSDKYKKQFRGLFDSEIFNSKIENYATKALKYNDNKPSETLFAIPTSLNPLLKEKRIDKKHYWDEKYFKNGKEINLAKELMKIKHKFVVVHNHPNNTSLSLEDLFALNDIDNMEAIISIGHNGKICSVKKKKCFSDKLEREFFEMAYARNVSNYGYTNEAIKHFCEEVGWIYDI